jgi:hypothetical protein
MCSGEEKRKEIRYLVCHRKRKRKYFLFFGALTWALGLNREGTRKGGERHK